MFVVVMHEVDPLPGPAGGHRGPLVRRRDATERGATGFSGGGGFLLKEMSDDSLIGFIDVGLETDR